MGVHLYSLFAKIPKKKKKTTICQLQESETPSPEIPQKKLKTYLPGPDPEFLQHRLKNRQFLDFCRGVGESLLQRGRGIMERGNGSDRKPLRTSENLCKSLSTFRAVAPLSVTPLPLYDQFRGVSGFGVLSACSWPGVSLKVSSGHASEVLWDGLFMSGLHGMENGIEEKMENQMAIAPMGERFCAPCTRKPPNGSSKNLLGTRQGF